MLFWLSFRLKITCSFTLLDVMHSGYVIHSFNHPEFNITLTVLNKDLSGAVNVGGTFASEAFLTGHFPQLQQHRQHNNVLPSKRNARSTVGDPDSWYVTLWLTCNHKTSDPFPSLCNFPSSSICFSFGETELFTLFLL